MLRLVLPDDDRWSVPTAYAFDVPDPSRPRARSRRLDWPEIHLFAFDDVERQLFAEPAGPLTLAAWQLSVHADAYAVRTVRAELATPSLSAEARLSCAHVLAIADAEGNDDCVSGYRSLWTDGSIATSHPLRLPLGVSLAASVLPYSADKSRELLERLRPLADAATGIAAATFDLVLAVTTLTTDAAASGEAIVRAHDRFVAAGHRVGMAQCALAEYQRERAGERRVALMLRYLRYAVHQYVVDGRYAWAAAVQWFAVVPLLSDEVRASDSELADALADGARYAQDGRSYREWGSLLHMAARLGFRARETNGSWVFERAQRE